MRVEQSLIQRYRNHTNTSIHWAPHLNVIVGPNGSGKTNIIDAIHTLCMSKSFVTGSDQYTLQKQASDYDISSDFSGSIRSHFSIRCRYKRGEGKAFFVNESPLPRLADLIGLVPVVVLSPQDRALTAEGPSERRSFIDSMISQLSSSYLSDLVEFRKITKQRNKLLSHEQFPDSVLWEYLEPWNEQLAFVGAKILSKRKKHLNEFAVELEKVYARLTGLPLKPRFEYKSQIDADSADLELIKDAYKKLISDNLEKERERGYTLVGPHRDDLTFFLDDIELRKFGSQGQHRIFTIALKMAELFYISEQLDDLPIFLLDDMFGDLDPQKISILLTMLEQHKGQTFITAANPALFDGLIHLNADKNLVIEVENGKLVK